MTGLADHPRRPKRVDAQEQFRLGVATKLRRHRRSFEMGTRRDQNTIRRTIATCPSIIRKHQRKLQSYDSYQGQHYEAAAVEREE